MYTPHQDTLELFEKILPANKKTALITGATDGIGLAFARIMAWAGWNIVLCARSHDKARKVISELQLISQHIKIHCVICDLSCIDSVGKAIQSIDKAGLQYDLVFFNAGITSGREERTDKGVSSVFFINHIAQQALLMGIQDHLADQSRVIIQSSIAHHLARDPRLYTEYMGINRQITSTVYADSKCANLCLALVAGQYLSRHLGRQIDSYAVHPGYLVTNINREMLMQPLHRSLLNCISGQTTPLLLALGSYIGMVQPSAEHAAHSAIVAALTRAPSLYTGPSGYFGLYGQPMPAKISKFVSVDRAERLWEKTADCITALKRST